MAKKTAPKKTTTERKPPAEPKEFDRFGVLFEEAQKFCAAVGLHDNLIDEIAKADSDWAFVLKIDALLETASKEIVRHALSLKVLNRVRQNDLLVEFVDSLPINGRTSILKLLEAAGCPLRDIGFIEATRRVRNAYAHNIKLVDVSLIDIIKQRGDKSEVLRKICAIDNYVEADLIAMYEKDCRFLRFCILDATLRILFFAYHIAVKHNQKK